MSDLFFDYKLPARLIANEPASERDQSRLLFVERSSGRLHHAHFFDLPELLRGGDLLVLNNTRVLQARLYGRRQKTGGKWEGLFLQETAAGFWDLLCQTRGWLQPGENIIIESGELLLAGGEQSWPGRWLMKPSLPGASSEILSRFGHVPLPPYVRGGKDAPTDRTRYQTIYADRTRSGCSRADRCWHHLHAAFSIDYCKPRRFSVFRHAPRRARHFSAD